ncbi:septum site-determining protein MinC [Anaerobacillus alkalidiazotrophicus]|uniref:Probable septum site-determining protein MinC n=1 Tax=Anaerobacillus alkalidiazotrophicus TaxID=472963 RepID=A0A1S2M0Y1_9BACI|nr:septum site-determining protein MinC [Anaerobacillus alkalidiazotrophicus]OIJ18382.1 septum site-determining protein MinC [Anaerobacillus alkalidiazotrophicus]OIJ19861.1 septum site-determining protein MinC [Anaerobacillus alkalidiazotrophicus]
MQKTNNITIRGTKEGLILFLDDECSFFDLVSELEEKLSSKYPQSSEGPAVQVKVSVGNRYLTEEQKIELKKIINDKQKLIINEIESNVMTKDEAENLIKESQMTTIVKVVRSGQVLEVKGDLLLIGDVNPGGTVVATGNIYILGVLRGIAHAGSEGDKDAVISASRMEPSQLRIAEIVSRSPDYEENETHDMECAYIGNDSNMAIERVQHLGKIRPKITNV